MLSVALTNAAIGGALVLLLMFALWLIHLRMVNASIVDVGWAASVGVLASIYALRAPGDPVRSWIIASMTVTWSVRLSTHLLVRIIGKPEEGRYVELRRKWSPNIEWKFLAFFECQALIALVLSLPMLLPTLDADPGLTSIEVAGVAIWLVAMVGESVADHQLKRFKSDPSNEGDVCDAGLWQFSRHPNYFFEWLVWVGFAVFALSSPWGWLGLVAPALMLYFLLRVTGVPPAEEQSLRSRGEAYRAYQSRTNAFFPWFPKRES